MAKPLYRGSIGLLAVMSAVLHVWAAPPTLKSTRIGGRDYVTVADVAKLYNLGRDLSYAADEARYSSNGLTLTVEADHREVQLNGVTHWLSVPALSSGNQLWVSAMDVLKALDPVLQRGRSVARQSIQTVVLYPGHGGEDRGTRGRRGIEKEMTLDLAKRIERHLTVAGLRVWLTRTSDRTMSLGERVSFGGAKKADLFISLHFNSGGSAQGIETYCLPPSGASSTANYTGRTRSSDTENFTGNRYDERNVWLAHCVQQELVSATRANDRGVRRARFYVLRDGWRPAILVEAGFLSSRTEEDKILKADYRETLAKAIAEGILTYKGSVASERSAVPVTAPGASKKSPGRR